MTLSRPPKSPGAALQAQVLSRLRCLQAPWLPERIFADAAAVAQDWRGRGAASVELSVQAEPGAGAVCLALAGMLAGTVQLSTRSQQVRTPALLCVCGLACGCPLL